MGRLDEDNMLPRNGSKESHIALAIGKATRMPLEGDVDTGNGELLSNPFSEGKASGAANNFHRDPGPVVWVGSI